MNIDLHGESEDAEFTAQLLAALLDLGKLPQFEDEVEERGLAWHAICRLEDDCLTFARRNPYCGATEGWIIVAGLADDGEVAIPVVPKYVGWGDVKAWLEYGNAIVAVEPGYGVHVFDQEQFESIYEPEAVVKAAFGDDSGMVMNSAFRLSPEDEKFLLSP